MRWTSWSLSLGVFLAGCYASHGDAVAVTEDLRIEDAWLDGRLGDVDVVASEAYAIEIQDRRSTDEEWMSVHVHTGRSGGAPHGWGMVGIGFAGLDPLGESLAPGTRTTFAGPSAPLVLWTCSGPAHAVQVFEEFADGDVRVEVDGSEAPGARVLRFEARLEGGEPVRGGLTISPRD